MLLYCSSPHKRNITAIQVFFTTAASSLQVFCKLVLQRCIAAQVQYNCSTRKNFSYCNCIALVQTA